MSLPRWKLLIRVTVLETLYPMPGDPRITLQLSTLKQVRVVIAAFLLIRLKDFRGTARALTPLARRPHIGMTLVP